MTKVRDQYVLAVDLGTSGCKAALVSVHGKVLAWEFESVETLLFPNGGAEQDTQAWWNAFLRVAKRLIAQGLVTASEIIAICCSSQGECTVPVDTEGRPLMNAILWMDARGREDLRAITGGPIRVAGYHPLRLWRWIRLTGGAPSLTGKDPAAHMLYVKHQHPDVYQRTYKFLNALDYLDLQLSARFVASYDSILTSWVTDNRDPSNVVYSEALLPGCGIAPEKFPEIVKCTDVIGTLRPHVARELGLRADMAIVAGATDNPASAVGSGAVRD
ncbi:MAG: FGGY family carbohydrate kinase [Candidatus Binatia bacterium]